LNGPRRILLLPHKGIEENASVINRVFALQMSHTERLLSHMGQRTATREAKQYVFTRNSFGA
jgi:hypothetical protein